MSNNPIPETVSRRISSLRWLACLVPVLAHAMQSFQFTGDFPLLSERLVLLLDDPYRWTEAVIFGWLGVGVVPMFFLFSGYLHYALPRPYGQALRRRVPRLLVPMVLWTVVFCAVALAMAPYVGLSERYNFMFTTDPGRWFTCLVGDYSHPFKADICCPTVYQFWYLRDLIVLILLGPVIGWGLRRVPVVFFTLVCASAFGGWRPLVVGTPSLMFYTLGAFCGMRKIDFFALVDRYCPWPMLTLALVVQVVLMRHLGNSLTLNPMVGCFLSCFFFLKGSAWLVANERRYAFLHRLDRQSFFLYCCHGGTIGTSFLILTTVFMPYGEPWMTAVGTFVVFALNALFCTGLGLALERWAPRVFALLTGGRK